jgi:hypothetical protein
MKPTTRHIALSATLFALGVSAGHLAFSQTSSESTGAASQATPLTKAEKKEARKQARKEARAKKNAELKKLNESGYSPSRNNYTQYPQNLQDAEKKAGAGAAAGASQ